MEKAEEDSVWGPEGRVTITIGTLPPDVPRRSDPGAGSTPQLPKYTIMVLIFRVREARA